MRRATILFITLACVATSASAQPKHEDYGDRVSIAPHKAKLQTDSGWTELASPTPVKYGTSFIVVGMGTRPFSQIRIEANGKVILTRLKLFFADGTSRIVPLGRMLDPKRASTLVDLPTGKRITQIAVTTEPWTRGKYTVHGSTGEAVAKH